MKKFITWITLVSFLWMVTFNNVASAGDPAEEGKAAGLAVNAFTRSSINAPQAAAHVPGYTTTPPEMAYFAQGNLASQANAQLANCAMTPADPVCQAQTRAMASATTPRPAVQPTDPTVAGAHMVERDPASVLDGLSAYYAGCTSAAGGTCPANVFCLGASCFNTAYTSDADFARTMSLMEAAREAGVYLDPATQQVFQGEAGSCRDRLLNNCCYTDSAGAGMSNQSLFGVGTRLVYDALMNSSNRQFIYQGISALVTGGGFAGSFTTYGVTIAVNAAAIPAGSVAVASGQGFVIAFDPWSLVIAIIIYIVMSMLSCNDTENRLAMQEGAGLCHSIGTYCSSCIRVLGHCVSCIEHTTGKCCFNSRLSRMINEQGRNQIGKGWGSAQSPDCSGFSIDQLQSLDFATMDLTEFYASIVPSLPNANAIQARNAARILACYYGQGQCP
ncbi:MAG: conjugal transfer protein TraN [Pseudomonadota bacterium]